VLRGYDPDEVMSAITELTSSLGIARRTAAERTMELSSVQARAASLEAELGETTEKLAAAELETAGGTAAFVGVGTRLTAILELAEEEAGQVRAEAQRYVDGLHASAEADAQRIRREAAESAEAVLREANDEAAALRRADAESQARIAEAERTAATVTQAARRESERAGQKARRVTAQAEATRDAVVTRLHGVLDRLADIESDLADAAPQRDGALTR